MKIFRLISRIIIGLVFVFSGFVKAIDPLGSAYKFHDYFQAFHLSFLEILSLPLAVLMCTLEFLAGFSLLSGIRQKAGIYVTFLLMLFFTPLTLLLLITNPVSDCGCFGDAIHLTNLQTFGKNLILMVLVIFLFMNRMKVTGTFKPATEWIITGIAATLFIGFSLLNLRYLPIIDFLPYSLGTYIPSKMEIPAGAASDQYSTTLIYEKNGRTEEFTINNYPAIDTTWKFVRQRSVLIKKGYEPPIHDFSVTSLDNEDITWRILGDKGYTLLMISKKLSGSDPKRLLNGFELGSYCKTIGISFYILTSSGSDEIKSFDNNLPFCHTDETALKTMIRSDPGYILLRNGTITGKWSWANVPTKEWFKDDLTGKQLLLLSRRNGLFLVIISFSSAGAVLLLYMYIANGKKKRYKSPRS